MNATMYIIKTQDAYRFGFPPVVRLWEPESVSRTWIRKVVVALPDGFSVNENEYGEPKLFCGNECYEIVTNKDENPVIVNHKDMGGFIPLMISHEGWD